MSRPDPIRRSRWAAAALGGAILAWQGVNAARGRFVHDFLPADLAVAALLLAGVGWPRGRAAAAVLLGGFAATAGVFLAASTAGLASGAYDLGRALTSLGLIPCVAGSVALGQYLARGAPGP